jgi:hypothetical protein
VSEVSLSVAPSGLGILNCSDSRGLRPWLLAVAAPRLLHLEPEEPIFRPRGSNHPVRPSRAAPSFFPVTPRRRKAIMAKAAAKKPLTKSELMGLQ